MTLALTLFHLSLVPLIPHILLVLSFTLRVLWRDDLFPSARLAWVIILMVLPYIGIIVYLFFGESSLGRTLHLRHEEIFATIKDQASHALGDCKTGLDGKVEKEYHPAFLASASVDEFQTTCGNHGELMPDADIARSRLLEDINAATDHVNVVNVCTTSGSMTKPEPMSQMR